MNYCNGSGKEINVDQQSDDEFTCPDCDISWIFSTVKTITVPDHYKWKEPEDHRKLREELSLAKRLRSS